MTSCRMGSCFHNIHGISSCNLCIQACAVQLLLLHMYCRSHHPSLGEVPFSDNAGFTPDLSKVSPVNVVVPLIVVCARVVFVVVFLHFFIILLFLVSIFFFFLTSIFVFLALILSSPFRSTSASKEQTDTKANLNISDYM